MHIKELVRNEAKAKAKFFDCQEDGLIEYIVESVENFDCESIKGL